MGERHLRLRGQHANGLGEAVRAASLWSLSIEFLMRLDGGESSMWLRGQGGRGEEENKKGILVFIQQL
jgi:hypothetical protein